jgi:hypothetical protein
MKVIEKRSKYRKGFSEELNKFFQLVIEFRRDRIFIPKGIFRFKTFEEAEKWRYKMTRGNIPDLQQ